MSKRGTVVDYAGNELYAGDLIAYAARQANRVRISDAVILDVGTRLVQVPDVGAVLVPVLKIQPTGVESGFTGRRSTRVEHITAEHVRLITPGFAPAP